MKYLMVADVSMLAVVLSLLQSEGFNTTIMLVTNKLINQQLPWNRLFVKR
jgi:hypothetical protein